MEVALVVPLLLRGLREKSTSTKRQSAVIINNMSKLVDDPIDAAPFLPLLLPALETNATSIPDPEARGVTEKAVEQLMRLKDLADKAVSVRGDTSKLEAEPMMVVVEEDDEEDDAEELCNCNFTLAYGTKILLHNTKMRLLRGKKYGLLGGNDSGKTTLMRSIA